MKIILTSVGTRGDIDPFIALADLLSNKGHQVICVFPEQFRELVENPKVEFASLGSKFIELLESDTGKAAMGGSTGWNKFKAIIKLARTQKESQQELIRNQYEIINRENPDRIAYNGKAIYPIIWETKNEGKTIFISPLPYMHYVEGHTHIAFNSNFGKFFNKLSFSLAHFGIVTTVMMSKKWLKIKDRISRKEIRNVVKNNKSIYTISPSLFPRPTNWDQNLKVLGYQERKKSIDYQPEESLKEFLNKHQKILFITFGSMSNPAPEEKTKIFLDIIKKNKIPAIINTASGGLINPGNVQSDLVYFVSRIPYDWIFPKMYGVIHHGGSGTTHLALKYGCASMIIPHIIDQFVWNKIIHAQGVGPKGMKIGKMTLQKLEPKMLDIFNNPSYKKEATRIAAQMNTETFEEELIQTIIE